MKDWLLLSPAVVRASAKQPLCVSQAKGHLWLWWTSKKRAATRRLQEIQRQGGKACFIRADVSNPSDVRNMAEQAVVAFGKINVLVNVAGVQGMVADVVELPEDEWYHVLNVNLTSVYLCTKYCIPLYA